MPRPRSRNTRHRWVVDRLGEQTASVEHDGDHVYDVPLALIPEDAKEGDVLAVDIERGRGGRIIRITLDAAETKRAKAQSARQLRDAAGKGGRGDIEL